MAASAVRYDELPNDLYRKSIEEPQRGIANNFSQKKGQPEPSIAKRGSRPRRSPNTGRSHVAKDGKNGAPGRQENDRSPPLPPRTSVTLKNQAAIASRLGVVMQAVAARSQTLPGNTTVRGAWTTDESWSWVSQPAANEIGPTPTAAKRWLNQQ
ncbi:hypothetical protein MRX96_044128 [Rhipicephalus microplus]